MCGIVAAAAKRDVTEILLEGLRRLEYRGYDSAGMALVDTDLGLRLHKYSGKVAILEEAQRLNPIAGCTGIAHTRWAGTHHQKSRQKSTYLSNPVTSRSKTGIFEHEMPAQLK